MTGTRHRRRRKNMTTRKELPPDVLLHNILPRLLVKSLICCSSVSKQWQSLVKSRVFANIHLKDDYHQIQPKRLLICMKDPCKFSTLDCESLDVGASRPLPFEVSSGNIWIKSSCNGLVFVVLKKNSSDAVLSDLILWNPLTGDYKTLAKTDFNKECYNVSGRIFELYYRSSDEDYRLLRVTCDREVYIYSLKSDSWRKVDSKEALQSLPDLGSCRLVQSTCLNESLYFLIYNKKYSIMKFDTMTEKFTELATPSVIGNQECTGLNAQRGCIYLCVKDVNRGQSFDSGIELWGMNTDGDWMKVSTYTQKRGCYLFREPLHLMRNRNWLIKSFNNGYLYKVDMEKQHNKGEACLYNLNGFNEEGRYIETFVSPNQYMS